MHNLSGIYKNITYFKGLNTLRFIAAYLVVIHHSETMKLKNGFEKISSLSLFSNGGNAVTFFFVLSGFLITYILLREKKDTQTVHVKNFYLKRVLRIWPLYYLLVILGAVIIPSFINYLHIDYEMPYTFSQTWYYFVFFLPLLVTFNFGHHLLEPLWSIGVEEVFYLIWAPPFKFVKTNILQLLLSVIIIKVILIAIPLTTETSKLYNYMVNHFKFEAMAIGGLGAYWIFHSKKSIGLSVLYKKSVQVIIYLILFIYLILDSNIENSVWRALFHTEILSLLLTDFLFLYLIIGVSLAENSVLRLENKSTSYLGTISYGIYMYHTIVISIVILCLKKLPISLNAQWNNLLFYVLVTIGVLLISHFSKKYFEDYFLNLKNKIM